MFVKVLSTAVCVFGCMLVPYCYADQTGTILSPNYPRNYGPNANEVKYIGVDGDVSAIFG